MKSDLRNIVLAILLGISFIGIINTIVYMSNNVADSEQIMHLVLFSISFITIIGFVLSIKNIENKLAVSSSRLKGVFDNMSSGLVVYKPTKDNENFIIMDFNPAAERITNVEKSKVINRRLTDVFPNMMDTPLVTALKKVNRTGRSIHVKPFFYEDKVRKGWRENRIYKLPSGEIVAIFEDVTKRMDTEQEKLKLQRKLSQIHKMEVIGNIAGRISHDFNNMLNVILGYSDLIKENVEKDSKIYKYSEKINKSAGTISDLTKKLLTFARKQIVVPKKINLNSYMEEITKELDYLLDKKIKLEWETEENLWPVKMCITQIKQILTNLCINSSDSMNGKGNIKIITRNKKLDKENCIEKIGLFPGDYVEIIFSDDGCGISENNLNRIFDPFYSTKNLNTRSGLGLSIVYGIIKQNNGFISVDSELDKGTTFNIYFPKYISEEL